MKWCFMVAMIGIAGCQTNTSAEAPPTVERPQRFAVETLRLPVAEHRKLAELGDGMSALQGVGPTDWGKIEPNPPSPGKPRYAIDRNNKWWPGTMQVIKETGRDAFVTMDLYSPWALERHPKMLVHDAATGKKMPAVLGLKQEYVSDYKTFIKGYLGQYPQITHLQLLEEPENKWADGKRLGEVFGYTKDALADFSQAHPDRDVKLLAAGFYIGQLALLPEQIVDTFLEVYPSIAANYPNVENELIRVVQAFNQYAPDAVESLFGKRALTRDDFQGKKAAQLREFVVHMARRASVIDGVIASGNFDILTLHNDSGATYDTIPRVIGWYRARMKKYGYERPIWVDDMHSGFYSSPSRLLGGANLSAKEAADYKRLENGEPKAIAGYARLQPTWLVRKAVGNFAAGAERISIAYAHDMPDYHAAVWRYVGLFNDKGVPKPAYYTAQLLIAKIDGFTTAECVKDHIYRFTFQDKPDVIVAWSETGNRTLDLSKHTRGHDVRVIPIINEVTRRGEAVRRETRTVPPNKIPLTEEPVILEVSR